MVYFLDDLYYVKFTTNYTKINPLRENPQAFKRTLSHRAVGKLALDTRYKNPVQDHNSWQPNYFNK